MTHIALSVIKFTQAATFEGSGGGIDLGDGHTLVADAPEAFTALAQAAMDAAAHRCAIRSGLPFVGMRFARVDDDRTGTVERIAGHLIFVTYDDRTDGAIASDVWASVTTTEQGRLEL